VHRPLGPVAAVTPWNFPLSLASWKLAPALRAGNTVVLKPSPYTPLSTLLLGRVLADVLPPGVVNVVTGGDALGERLVTHPLIRKVSFTGSVATGKRIAEVTAGDLKRLTLELGGNDPAIVLDDANPEAIAKRLFWAAFANCGQVCSAVKRVYAPEPIYDRLVAALAEQAERVTVAGGFEEGVRLGPVNNERQVRYFEELVAEARAGGARVAAGGERLERGGYFFAPTVLADVDDDARIVSEEQFGPALPIVRYRDVKDALARANGTTFGLGGSVWSGDPDRAAAVACRLECGTASVNAHVQVAHERGEIMERWDSMLYGAPPYGLPHPMTFNGTPQQIIDQIGGLNERFGIEEFVFLVDFPAPYGTEVTLEMLELLGTEVLPAFGVKGAPAAAGSA
jgi:acyl-CoA reductase-like NAD-dependent aldehyde dehydrogenase